MKITQITHANLAAFLKAPDAADLLGVGVGSTGGRLTVADAIHLLQIGHIQLWAALEGTEVRGLVLSEITQYPQFNALKLFGLAGADMGELVKLFPVLKAFGRDHGCRKIEILDTRSGMGVLPGAVKTGVCLEISTEELAEVA